MKQMESTNKTSEKPKLPKQNPYIFESNRKYFSICIYALFVIAFGAILIRLIMNWKDTQAGIANFLGVLSPFFAAFLIAYLLYPITRWIYKLLFYKLTKQKARRTCKFLSIFLAYILTIGLIILFVNYVTPQIAQSMVDLSPKILEWSNSAVEYVQNVDQKYPTLDFAVVEEYIANLYPQLMNYGTNLIKNVVPMLFNVSVNVVKIVINLVLAFVISCYMISDKNLLITNCKRLLYAIFKKETADNICSTGKECNKIFSGFIIGKAIDSFIIGVLCFLLMSIFRFDYAVLLSVIVGVTNMIPYFGPFIGVIPGICLYLIVNPLQAVFFGILILCLQQFDGLWLGPKILGSSTGLKPLWVIFAITVGGAYFGVLGMFLGVPVVAVISYLLDTFIKKQLQKKNIIISETVVKNAKNAIISETLVENETDTTVSKSTAKNKKDI